LLFAFGAVSAVTAGALISFLFYLYEINKLQKVYSWCTVVERSQVGFYSFTVQVRSIFSIRKWKHLIAEEIILFPCS